MQNGKFWERIDKLCDKLKLPGVHSQSAPRK